VIAVGSEYFGGISCSSLAASSRYGEAMTVAAAEACADEEHEVRPLASMPSRYSLTAPPEVVPSIGLGMGATERGLALCGFMNPHAI